MASFMDRLLNRRSISYQTLWGSGEDVVIGTQAGTYVTPDTVFKVNAIYSAVSLIADTISTLPLDAFIRVDGERRPFRAQYHRRRVRIAQAVPVQLLRRQPGLAAARRACQHHDRASIAPGRDLPRQWVKRRYRLDHWAARLMPNCHHPTNRQG